MTPEERGQSQTLVYQYLPSRYGMNPDDLRKADAIEVVVGQGAKPGGGGMLLGQKISDRVAQMRTLPQGIDQRSACRHPDWTGPDDLEIKIEELRELTDWQKPIYVKIGIPILAAIRPAVQALQDQDMHRKVQLIVSGGIRNGADVAKAMALGADAVAIGTAALVALGDNDPSLEAEYQALGTTAGAYDDWQDGSAAGGAVGPGRRRAPAGQLSCRADARGTDRGTGLRQESPAQSRTGRSGGTHPGSRRDGAGAAGRNRLGAGKQSRFVSGTRILFILITVGACR